MRLEYVLGTILFLGVKVSQAQDWHLFSLSKPRVEVDSVFFHTGATVAMEMAFEGADIRYTVDNTPVTENSPVFAQPLYVGETTTIRARSYHERIHPSDEVMLTVHRLWGQQSLEVTQVFPDPHPAYSGSGLSALTDRQKGAKAFRSTPDQWMGWELDSIQLQFIISNPVPTGQLIISALEDPGAWILGPRKITVKHQGEVFTHWIRPNDPDLDGSGFQFPGLSSKGVWPAGRYELVVYATTLPPEHPGAGRKAWIFIDEIFLTKAK